MTYTAPDLAIVIDNSTEGATVTVTGEIDLATAPQLRDAALRALRQGDGPLRLDLRGVTFLDSTGLHVLLATRRRAELEGRQLLLAHVSTPVQRLLEITATDALFPRADSSASTVAAAT